VVRTAYHAVRESTSSMIGRRGSIVDASIILNGEAASVESMMRHSLRERRIRPCFDIAMQELCQEIGRSLAFANSLFEADSQAKDRI